MTSVARQRMTVAGLSFLWFLPPAIVAWLVATAGQSFLQPVLELWSVVSGMPLPIALLVAAVYAYVYAGITLWRRAAWIDAGRHALAESSRDPRPLGFYIRPFTADLGSVLSDSAVAYPFSAQQSEELPNPFGWLSESISKTRRHLDGTHLDQFLGPMFRSHIGELVALGDPRDWLPRRGAARIYLSHSSGVEWQTTVVELLKRSHIVILLAGESSGLAWELRYLREHVPPRRVILVTSPSRPASTWAAQVRALTDAGWIIPPHDPGSGCVITFDATYTGFLLRRGALKAQDYVEVMAAHLRSESGGERVAWPDKPSAPPLPSILGLD